MAVERQETVTHHCMHAGVHTLRGTRAEQAAQLERLRLVDCPQCQRNEATARAATDATRLALPALSGTHTEVAEALRERARRVRAVADAARGAYLRQAIATSQGPLEPAARAQVEERARAAGERAALQILAHPLARTQARWWIEARDLDIDEMIAHAAEREI